MKHRVAAVLSALLPGFGQWARGMWVEGALLLFLVLYLRLTLAGLAELLPGDTNPFDAFVLGWFAFPTGAPARVSVLTVVVLLLHGFAAWQATSSVAVTGMGEDSA